MATKKTTKTIRARRTTGKSTDSPTAWQNRAPETTVTRLPTTRDDFAMAALIGALPAYFSASKDDVWADYDDFATTVFNIADAMVREQQRRG
jgi:hypothetical protein